MSKKTAERKLDSTEAMAIGNALRISSQKLNLVAQSIRGLAVEKAIAELTFSKKRIAGDVKKVLQSAIANAENNHNLDIDKLYVKEAYIGKNITMKRWRPRSKGRAFKILKPFSNITIIVKEREETI